MDLDYRFFLLLLVFILLLIFIDLHGSRERKQREEAKTYLYCEHPEKMCIICCKICPVNRCGELCMLDPETCGHVKKVKQ